MDKHKESHSESKRQHSGSGTHLMNGRDMYLGELGAKLRELDRLLHSPGGEGDPAGAVYRLLHSVKGSAPVFGWNRLGDIALEQLPLWEWAADGGAGGGPIHWRTEAAETIRRLGWELERCNQEPATGDMRPPADPDPLGIRGSRILVIDDEEPLRTYLCRRLSLDGYEVHEADGVDAALVLLREKKYDLILLDLMMEPRSGFELFETLKEDPGQKWIPLIVLSGMDGVSDKVRCFRLGSDDYVTKPFQYEELEARIHNLIQRTKAFEQMAFLDPLTGVNNRRYFDRQLELELQRVLSCPAPLSIIFLDIDRFKKINDSFGHNIGDQVLQGLAYRLQRYLGSTDLLARYGGEEFVVVMPGARGGAAQEAMDLILSAIRTEPVAYVDGEELRVTFSAGVAEWNPGEAKEAWIHRADQAMYTAKLEGRDRVLLYAPQMEDAAEKSAPTRKVPRKKLLIAEDDAVLRSILATKFREQQVEVLEAEDGEEALHLLRTERPDAAIVDALMPKLGGLELLEAVRSDPITSGAKILMLSGLNKRKDIVRGLQSGADDYMAKPFSILELELRVKRLIGI